MDYTKEEVAKIRQEESWLEQFKLDDDRVYDIASNMTRVILGTDSLDSFFDKIVKIVKDQVLAKQIALQAAQLRFLPFQKDIADLDEFIKKMGGKVPPPEKPAEPKERELEPDTVSKMVFSSTDEEEIKSLPKMEHNGPSADDYTAQAQAIIKEFGFKEKDEVIAKRLQNFIIGKLRNVRDDIELLEVLTKSRKVGGMEMDGEKARFLIKLINDRQKSFHNGIVPEFEPEETAKPKIEFPVYQEPMAKKKPASAKAATDENFKPLTLAEKREKDGFAHFSPPYQGGDEEGAMKDILEDADNSKEIVPSNKGAFKTPPVLPLERGGKNAVTSAFLSKEEVEDLPIDTQDFKKKDSGRLPPKEDVYPIIEEEDGLPVIRMPQEMMAKPKILPLKKPAPKEPVAPVKKEEIISAAVIKESLGDAPAESIKREIITAKSETKIVSSQKPTNLPPPKPAPYIASAKSLPPKTAMYAGKRPSLDDVKFVRKLVGPIEELETMTIIDFRRLDPDPKAAVKKIKEKIILLEKELYQKRAEGIAAWHKSEVSRFYRLLGQASMAEGRSIEEIISERQQAGKPTLTIEEFNAIMEVNRELRY